MQRRSFALLLAAHLVTQQAPADPSVSSSKSPAPLSLTEALRRARASSPALGTSQQAVTAAQAAREQASRWSNPTLEISSEDIPSGNGGFSSAQNMIGLSQTIPYPGKKRLDAGISQQSVTLAEAGVQRAERELVRGVRVAFVHALAAQERVLASKELLSLDESLMDATRKRVASGAAARQEMVRAEIETERVRVALTSAQRALDEARITLAACMGASPDTLGKLRGTLRETAPAYAQTLWDQALARDPGLLAANARREQSRLEVERAGREARPDLTLGVAVGHVGSSDEDVMELRASVPLPVFDRAQGRKREARALAEAARLDHVAAEQDLRKDFALSRTRLASAQEEADLYRTRILPKAAEALSLVRGGFEAGKFGFLDLVDTQRTAAESRLEYIDKLLELNLAMTELETLAGLEFSE